MTLAVQEEVIQRADEARRLQLAGWVRNLDSGGVEAVFEGPRQIVERMGGAIAVESTPGRGSTFRCTIAFKTAECGEDGLPHRYLLYSGNQPPRAIKTKETGLVIRPGDRLVLESGGGGGWGDPAKRDPAAQARDVGDGFSTSPHPNRPPPAGEGGHISTLPSTSPPPQAGEG